VAFLQWALPRLQLRWPGFRHVRRQVCRRLARRLGELDLPDLAAYRARLEADPDPEAPGSEWRTLDACCRITISRFLRDRAVFERLGQRVLPALAVRADAEARPLRAWCAGCAGGEEAYGLRALWQEEVAPHHPRVALAIVATDVDGASLARARAGAYAPSSLKEASPAWRQRVFDWRPGFGEGQGRWVVRAAFRGDVAWIRQDLRQVAPRGVFDLVLCRNLAFTYFDAPLQRAVLARIARHLRPGGALVVGLHERLPEGAEAAAFEAWPGERAILRHRGAPAAPEALDVVCDNGDPIRFGPAGAPRVVAEVLDRWPGESHHYVRVRATDGGVYILRHDLDRDTWTIHAFEEDGAAPDLP
jgi:chemotaxis protein methyltransferase CheR